jgi:hypothetical protein
MRRSSLVALVLLLSLSANFSLPLAAEPIPRAAARLGVPDSQLEGLLGHLWDVLRSLWTTKEGCTIDPLGRCLHEPAPTPEPSPTTKEGCRIDPLGSCSTVPTLAAKAGCRLDPLGACASGPGK